MTAPTLNLARKWRSKQFDQVVGQALTIRILKNTLYSGSYFPVYLFSGNKGCGKTSTARIFASAVNCERLSDFQKNPRSVTLPCLECASCKAMSQLQHPDFIEIDAASHTGVDNVRIIIDAASLLPVLGKKKIYLIDEAHMLSKSAFNAFLKILEEPPMSTLFLLATTDPHKIIDTVRSRCFQLFFEPLEPAELQNHLESICQAESIKAEPEALLMIAQETMGCVRDALNLLEQLRFGHPLISVEVVTKNLGYLPETSLKELITLLQGGNLTALIIWLEHHNDALKSPLTAWNQCKNYIREQLKSASATSQQLTLIKTLEILYDYELPLQKSSQQKTLLELMFLSICKIPLKQETVTTPRSETTEKAQPPRKIETPSLQAAQASETAPPIKQPTISKSAEWDLFMSSLETVRDPLLLSIFRQSELKEHNKESNTLSILFSQSSPFFKEWITESEKTWAPLLEKAFKPGIKLIINFDTQQPSRDGDNSLASQNQKNGVPISEKKAYTASSKKTPLDISDKEVWKTSHMLLEAFGGTITELPDDKKIT